MLRRGLAVLALVGAAWAQDDPSSLAARLAAIRPNEAELAYRAIGWRNRFWPAVEEAKRLGRPLLFWTMNGHPLGCT
ncbi:MAG: hypothetical protein RL398_928 [Planctomycetota bacterium]|jgi:hypothetical protein